MHSSTLDLTEYPLGQIYCVVLEALPVVLSVYLNDSFS